MLTVNRSRILFLGLGLVMGAGTVSAKALPAVSGQKKAALDKAGEEAKKALARARGTSPSYRSNDRRCSSMPHTLLIPDETRTRLADYLTSFQPG